MCIPPGTLNKSLDDLERETKVCILLISLINSRVVLVLVLRVNKKNPAALLFSLSCTQRSKSFYESWCNGVTLAKQQAPMTATHSPSLATAGQRREKK